MPYDRIVRLTLILLFGLSASLASAQESQQCTELPLISIDMQGAVISADSRVSAHMAVYDNGEGRNCLTDTAVDEGAISISLRGGTSLTFDKKQYRIETQTLDGVNRNVSLLGMPEENDWILNGPYSDKSLMRNALAYSLSAGMGHYAPRLVPCELILNGEYLGLYWLTEKIKRDDHRLDIARVRPVDVSGDELTGGYLLKIDEADTDPCGWSVGSPGRYIQPEHPRCDDIMDEQRAYIVSQTTELAQAIMDPDIDLWSRLDIVSTVDYFLINELSKNVDAYRKSTFFYKRKDSNGGKFYFGPVWDYNIAFGNVNFLGGHLTSGFIAERDIWWTAIWEDPDFKAAVQSRWSALRSTDGLLHPSALSVRLDSMTHLIEGAVDHNFDRWEVLGREIWPNYYHGQEYDQDLDYLRSWVINRAYWLDTAFGISTETSTADPKEVILFPNPFQYFLTLSVDLRTAGRLEVRFSDLQGRLIYAEDLGYCDIGRQVFPIRSSGGEEYLVNGLYIVRVLVDGIPVHQETMSKRF